MSLLRIIFLFPLLIFLLFLGGCGSYGSSDGSTPPAIAQDQAAGPRAIIHPDGGTEVAIDLEVARTPAEKEKGLMERRGLAAGSGMIFVFDRPVKNPFWMKNTHIPLSIAFVSREGEIVDIQDMEPLTLDLHNPAAAYLFAIETNKGFFAENGIKVGERVVLEGI